MIRIVKMTFQESKVGTFLKNFEANKSKIRAFEGCQHLELWRDKKEKNTFFTYSIWDNEASLEKYRHSELFKSVWAKTKVLFDEKPTAWSVDSIVEVQP